MAAIRAGLGARSSDEVSALSAAQSESLVADFLTSSMQQFPDEMIRCMLAFWNTGETGLRNTACWELQHILSYVPRCARRVGRCWHAVPPHRVVDAVVEHPLHHSGPTWRRMTWRHWSALRRAHGRRDSFRGPGKGGGGGQEAPERHQSGARSAHAHVLGHIAMDGTWARPSVASI